MFVLALTVFLCLMQGAVVADAVNLAAQIMGLNKIYGAYVSLTDETLFAIKEPNEYRHRFIDKVRVKGQRGRSYGVRCLRRGSPGDCSTQGTNKALI